MANIIEIDNFNDSNLDIYARLSERELLHFNEPGLGIFIAESPNVISRALASGYEPISFLMEASHVDTKMKTILDAHPEVPCYVSEFDVLTKLTGFKLTRGALCALRRKALPTVAELCSGKNKIAVLENVVNPTNIGAIIRSAAALNIEAILLTDGCCDPLYRRAIRVSMGTIFQIPWTFINNSTISDISNGTNLSGNSGGSNTTNISDNSGISSATTASGSSNTTNISSTSDSSNIYDLSNSSGSHYIDLLHSLGYKTAAMALKEDSVDIDDETLNKEKKIAIILGTEGDGLCDTTIRKSDYTICIPMSHGVDSLNVAAASAIAFWQLGR